MHDPAYLAIAAACMAALAAINIAYTVRRRLQQRAARLQHQRLTATEHQLAQAVRAQQRRGLDLTVAGDFAALGRERFLARFLASHPELQATGQKGETT